MSDRAIALDANILIRAVLGKRVRELILDNAERVQFFSPDVAYADAKKYLPQLLEKRGIKSESTMAVLDALESIVWPVLACAMAIGCPVWTEDADFFGTGVAIWTSDRVELYLADG